MIEPFEELSPRLGKDVFVAPSALVMGDVSLGDESSIWYGSVIRGDVHSISIGARTNVQDRSVVHVTSGRFAARVGDDVTIGHGAVVHGCHVGNRCLVGIGAIVLDGVEVGDECVVAAGSLLAPGAIFEPHSLIMGAPASRRREVTPEEIHWIVQSAQNYVQLARRHGKSR